MDKELEEHLKLVKQDHAERTFFIEQRLGSEIHWFFTQGTQALKSELYLPACSSFIIGIEASLRMTLAALENKSRVKELDSKKTLSNRLLLSAKEKGLPIELLSFPGEGNFSTNLSTKGKTLRNVEIVRVRHNLCHGNILEYVNTELGENNEFFTPECCRNLTKTIYEISRKWTQGLGEYQNANFKA